MDSTIFLRVCHLHDLLHFSIEQSSDKKQATHLLRKAASLCSEIPLTKVLQCFHLFISSPHNLQRLFYDLLASIAYNSIYSTVGSMETVIAQVKRLAGNANEATRKQMIDQLRELSYSLETPDDTLQRVMYLVSKGNQML